jgi:hypothetical protein
VSSPTVNSESAALVLAADIAEVETQHDTVSRDLVEEMVQLRAQNQILAEQLAENRAQEPKGPSLAELEQAKSDAAQVRMRFTTVRFILFTIPPRFQIADILAVERDNHTETRRRLTELELAFQQASRKEVAESSAVRALRVGTCN